MEQEGGMIILFALLRQFLFLCPLFHKEFESAKMQIGSSLICAAEEKMIALKTPKHALPNKNFAGFATSMC